MQEIEHGSFSPLVFSAAGGMGTIATVVYKRLASLLAEKQGRPYSSTLYWLRCRLNFSLLRSAIMCIRGSRSTFSPDSTSPTESIDLALHEGQVSAFEFLSLHSLFVSSPVYIMCIMFTFLPIALPCLKKKACTRHLTATST